MAAEASRERVGIEREAGRRRWQKRGSPALGGERGRAGPGRVEENREGT